MTRYFTWAGGRKVGLGLLAAVLLTAMAFLLKDVGFIEYSGALLLAFGITQGTVAYEDSRRPEWRAYEAQAEMPGRRVPEAAGWDDVKWPEGRIVVHETDREEEERAIAERAVARAELERRARRSY